MGKVRQAKIMGCHGREVHTNQLSSWTRGEVTQRREQNNQFRDSAHETVRRVGKAKAGGNAQRLRECLSNWSAICEIGPESAPPFD